MKVPFVTGLALEKVWKAVGWVEKNNEVPIFIALQSVMERGALCGGDTRAHGV